MENFERQNQLETTKNNDYRQETFSNLNQMLNSLKKWNVSNEKLEHIIDYVWKLAEIETKYWKMKDEIRKDVRFFIKSSLWDLLYSHLWEYNIKKFDIDWKIWIDKVEEDNYWKSIWEAVNQMIILWWLKNFSKVHYNSTKEDTVEWIANKVSLEKYLLWEKWEKHFAEWLIQKVWSISESELKTMQDNKFNITSSQSRKELSILLAKEFWDWVEDVLRFIWNIPSWIILFPRYATYRTEINSDDQITKTKAQINLDELVQKNPSLWILEILWEKWLEILKNLWEMLTSWKQWDIAMMMVTIAWMIAWWAWLAKFGLNIARKSAIKEARLAWREARISWQTISKETRNGIKGTSQKAWKVAEVAWKVDDIVWWAGVWHITGAYSTGLTDKLKEKWKNFLNSMWETIADTTENYLKKQWLVMWVTEDMKWFWETIELKSWQKIQITRSDLSQQEVTVWIIRNDWKILVTWEENWNEMQKLVNQSSALYTWKKIQITRSDLSQQEVTVWVVRNDWKVLVVWEENWTEMHRIVDINDTVWIWKKVQIIRKGWKIQNATIWVSRNDWSLMVTWMEWWEEKIKIVSKEDLVKKWDLVPEKIIDTAKTKLDIPEDVLKKYPFIENYRENIEYYFKNWEFKENDIIWEWNYWLAIRIPNWKVLKIAKTEEWAKALKQEVNNQILFYRAVEKLRTQLWNSLVPDWFKIPLVVECPIKNKNSWYYSFEMEEIVWNNLLSYLVRDEIWKKWLDLPLLTSDQILEKQYELLIWEDIDKLRNWYNIDIWLDWKKFEKAVAKWQIKWVWVPFTSYLFSKYFPEKYEIVANILYTLKKWGYIHNDLHSKNIMIWESWDIYVIDFWIVDVPKIDMQKLLNE